MYVVLQVRPTSAEIGLDHKTNLYTHVKCILANLHGSQTVGVNMSGEELDPSRDPQPHFYHQC